MGYLPYRTRPEVSVLGAINQPSSGRVDCTVSWTNYSLGAFRLDFTLTKCQLAVTDTGAGGSSGSHKLFDFNEGAVSFLGCRQDYTSFVEGSALTTGAGDAQHVLAIGTVAANAGDGALTGTEADIGSVTGTITNVAGTGAGTQANGPSTSGFNGTATALDMYLNWSGTAATIDANSTIDVTGTVSVSGFWMGDD